MNLIHAQNHCSQFYDKNLTLDIVNEQLDDDRPIVNGTVITVEITITINPKARWKQRSE